MKDSVLFGALYIPPFPCWLKLLRDRPYQLKLDGMGWRDEEYQKFSAMRGGISRALCDWKTQYNIEQCRWW